MTIAYAKRNPLTILTVPDEVRMKLEAVLNLTLTKTTANYSKNNESTDTNGQAEPTKPTHWRDTIDFGHIDNSGGLSETEREDRSRRIPVAPDRRLPRLTR